MIGGAWWLTSAVGSAFALASILARVPPASPAVLLAAVALAGVGDARWEAHEVAAPPPISALRGVHTLTAVAREASKPLMAQRARAACVSPRSLRVNQCGPASESVSLGQLNHRLTSKDSTIPVISDRGAS